MNETSGLGARFPRAPQWQRESSRVWGKIPPFQGNDSLGCGVFRQSYRPVSLGFYYDARRLDAAPLLPMPYAWS